MSAEGFVNEAPLYWHFDWGNQLYVRSKVGRRPGEAISAAWYGFGGEADELVGLEYVDATA